MGSFKIKLDSIKTQLIIFLGLFALYLSFKDRDATLLLTTSVAVVSAIIVDSVLSYLKSKKIAFGDNLLRFSQWDDFYTFLYPKKITLTESSLISGLIIGLVVSSDQPLWIFVFVPFLAILSKHLLRIRGRHLFNPAAFGIFLSIILLNAQTQWKGTYLWYILVPAGLYFTYKIRKLWLLVGYFSTALLLFGIQAIIQKTPLLEIFGYLSYFYIFVMVIEPKTTPIKPLGKLIFGIGIAILIFVLTEAQVKFDAELCALLVFNLAVPLLNKLPDFRKYNRKEA